MSSKLTVDATGTKLMLAIPSGDGSIPVRTAFALLTAIKSLSERGINYELHVHEFNSLVTGARDELAHEFCKTDCTHIAWLDSDIIFKAEDFVTMFLLSHKYPIVAATYITKNLKNPRFIVKNMGKEFNEHGLLECEGLGFGFVFMQRQVMLDVCSDPDREPFETYVEKLPDGTKNRVGEDMHFFRMARAKGHKVMINPFINLIHRGICDFEGDFKEVALNYVKGTS